MESKSCITDKPVFSTDNDKLQAQDYALALSRFIQCADTPVTIGVQGGWGSGKTSLISMLQEFFNRDENHKVLSVFVNAWEHSLFQETGNKSEVALSLLGGLTDGISKSIENANWIDKEISKEVYNDNKIVNNALSALKLGIKLTARVATQMISNSIGAGDISGAWANTSDDKGQQGNHIPMAQHVHTLRASLNKQITRITQTGKPAKIVFFVDDLDRVPPATAVEILDITKNIFDIPNCVFILAIDYDVVVKGLEEKFGPKSRENEREFRQYFDKIIQIPFTMPVGAYAAHLDSMVHTALEQLGLTEENDKGLMQRLATDAQLATGGIPRSIKRIVNTLSLLNYISQSQEQKEGERTQINAYELEARFIIVALHIAFPEICRRMMERSDFTKWERKNLDEIWKLESKKYDNELKFWESNSLFDDEWEKVLYCMCGHTEWLKAQAKDISQLLNNLLIALNNGNTEEKVLSEDGASLLATIFESIRVVSIDSETSTQFIDDSSVKTDRCSRFCQDIHRSLVKRLPEGVLASPKNEYAKRYSNWREYKSIYKEKTLLIEWRKEDDAEQNVLFIFLGGKRKNVKKADAEKILSEYNHEYSVEGRADFYFYKRYPNFKFEEFGTRSIENYVKDTITMYEALIEAEKALEQYAK